MGLTPEQEAAYALDYDVRRADLKPHVQAAYDRLLEQRRAEAARPWTGTLAPAGQTSVRAGQPGAPGTWQGFPPQTSWQKQWSVWLCFAGLSSVVVAFLVGGFGGSDATDAANLSASALFLFGLAAVFVAIPGLLYRRHRARRMAATPPRSPFAPCHGCGYPLAVHLGDELLCPPAGICHRCGQPLTVHSGYELTCPGSTTPHCYRCGQPLAAHAGAGSTCPAPWVAAAVRT